MQQRQADKTAPGKPAAKPSAAKPQAAGKPLPPQRTVAAHQPTKPPAPSPETDDLKPVSLGRASDEELMRRTQNGDRQAFSLLYERYSASVLSYLYRMLGNVEDVESIGQEVFLRAFRFAPTYRYPQKFSTWLFTITRNLAINQSRRRKRSPVRNITELNLEGMDISGDPYQVAARATNDIERQEEIAQVLKALDDLPTDQKEVIVLGVFQDLSYAEIEDITGTKAVTLRSRMFHGLKRLARTLGAPSDEPEKRPPPGPGAAQLPEGR
ncbi:MAG TPA: sigma-70 family RNA polymerase sigma factor [Tepidisphaeraceae bacterium]|nr:sigma-70 family RNA polymerase sigma factor [Tepidisphaeraceae bacterium]